ncbi:CRISPR-associated family protein [Lyngbya aestuarii BL J]|uniref:CRISPR-associated family protein n=1 Tax=Lyngbya aestuarii BL J TaxID=1348334 RepID=U7QIB4_9CYAN|nr:CRISPR-associated protein Csx3 [Lyngbya aestuarii]ERT07709.1 CRISPR-associated family protein [Lyngbya aestuarii BL J]
MTTYNIQMIDGVLQIGFGDPAQNDQIVRDAAARLEEMSKTGELKGGELLRVNDPCSLPVAMTLAHKVSHLFGAVGVFDPKMGKYVISITHNPNYKLGDCID